MSQYQYKMNSKLCPLYLVTSDQGLQGIFWKKQLAPMTDGSHPILKKTIKQLEEFLNGKRQEFDLPLDIIGTDFQKRVWKALQEIPYGKTCSYKDIAKKLNDKNASRAVGTANGKNPLSIVVPCHRVITSSGTLGGYAGGLNIKETLLQLEKARN